jgi:hypothetical protein
VPGLPRRRLSAERALNEVFDGPRLLGLLTVAEQAYSWLDGELTWMNTMLAGSQSQRVTSKPTNLVALRTIVRELATRMSDALPPTPDERKREDTPPGRLRGEVRAREVLKN